MKHAYVTVMRGLGAALDGIGVLTLLDRWSEVSRWGLWLRSLFTIYDPAALARLDVPWWTFAATEQVASHLERTSNARVFEWGAGASTLWLAKRAGSVTSVEHDSEWADLLTRMLPGNARVLTVVPIARTEPGKVLSAKTGFTDLDFSEYVSAIDAVTGSFDLIVIDGRAREACLGRAVTRLAPGGLIVFDNVDRERYRDAIEALGHRVEVRWTRGLTPALPYPTRTALLSNKETSVA
jgi:precorrin-6B methylase 2